MNSRKKSAIEALIGSQGLTLIGFATVPFVAWLSGASVSAWQGAQMGVYFAVGRFFYWYVIRRLSARWLK